MEGFQAPHRGRNAFYIQGDNHSDDLFMYLKAVLTGEDGICRTTRIF
jgi:hypothetical protein